MRVMFAGNYLRVRGEYSEETLIDAAKRELPPRARRILAGSDTDFDVYGTTSACAENTGDDMLLKITQRNYLRVRGEYGFTTQDTTYTLELPPRARRIQQ